ncbi:predicted protein [Botrytis cinerea T4]|uniref:Uncharacterized protein n=1 Tax=Botryotinia fuckeliana (strain T4) TaxID=999810 RepID=G2Y7J0_BOTF4|nr:predicted protein [Botrytis cinerea T4]
MCQSRQESRALEGLGGDGQEVNQGNEETAEKKSSPEEPE